MKKNSNEKELERRLGLEFKDPQLLHTALVHRSYLNEVKSEKSSNERLEFLGDAILEFLVSRAIYEQFPRMDEGELTALRSRLVNTVSLSESATALDLGNALYLSRGEEDGGGRKNPSLLADTLEAVIGAIFLDQGLAGCAKLVETLILPKAQLALTQLKDPKSLLQEKVQADDKPAPVYKIISQTGPDHARIFTVGAFVDQTQLGIGTGKSKQAAEKEAAKKALENLDADLV